MIDFSPFPLSKIFNHSYILKYINHLLTFSVSISFLIVSCSSTKRFPTEEKIKTDLTTASPVRVLLEEAETAYYLTIQSAVFLYQGNRKIASIFPGNVIESFIEDNGIRLTIQDRTYTGSSFQLVPEENAKTVRVNGIDYKGELKLINLGTSIGIINQINLEDYIKGVVAKEMPVGSDSENFEALKAFAICVRTYTLKKISEGKTLYDLYDDTRDQVYGGMNAEHPLSNEAVNETANKILKFEGEVAEIYYHSTCGGYTEAAHNVFTKEEIPYMLGIKDGNISNCSRSPKFGWKETYKASDLIGRLKNASLIDDNNYSLENVYIKSRYNSGRVKELVFILSDRNRSEKSISIYGNEIRSVLRTANGKNILWSTFFDLMFNGSQIELSGKGFGHGVGLCQWGAINLSREGWNYDRILEHYFPGIEIETLND